MVELGPPRISHHARWILVCRAGVSQWDSLWRNEERTSIFCNNFGRRIFPHWRLATILQQHLPLLDENQWSYVPSKISIGTRKGWDERLRERQVELRGHRLVHLKY